MDNFFSRIITVFLILGQPSTYSAGEVPKTGQPFNEMGLTTRNVLFQEEALMLPLAESGRIMDATSATFENRPRIVTQPTIMIRVPQNTLFQNIRSLNGIEVPVAVWHTLRPIERTILDHALGRIGDPVLSLDEMVSIIGNTKANISKNMRTAVERLKEGKTGMDLLREDVIEDDDVAMDELIRRFQSDLRPIERDILKRAYGIGRPRLDTDTEIASDLGPSFSRDQIRAIRRKAIEKLRRGRVYQRWDEQSILEAIRALQKEGSALNVRDVRQRGRQTLINSARLIFGSWEFACRHALAQFNDSELIDIHHTDIRQMVTAAQALELSGLRIVDNQLMLEAVGRFVIHILTGTHPQIPAVPRKILAKELVNIAAESEDLARLCLQFVQLSPLRPLLEETFMDDVTGRMIDLTRWNMERLEGLPMSRSPRINPVDQAKLESLQNFQRILQWVFEPDANEMDLLTSPVRLKQTQA